jgi:hypothetical protein
MKIVKRGLLALLIVFLLGQFVRPNLANPPHDPAQAIQNVPPDIEAIIQRSCIDCHTHNTRWPWYAQITPVNWWLRHHVDEGREHLNLSRFATYPPKRAAHKMEEVCEMVNKREMPLKSYLPLHPDARLSPADRNRMCDWANAEKARMEAGTPISAPR